MATKDSPTSDGRRDNVRQRSQSQVYSDERSGDRMLKECGQRLLDNDFGNVVVVAVIVGERDEINRQRM